MTNLMNWIMGKLEGTWLATPALIVFMLLHKPITYVFLIAISSFWWMFYTHTGQHAAAWIIVTLFVH